jgi:FkbM family methyltransferase
MKSFSHWISKQFRGLVYTKRYSRALFDHLLPARSTYAQHHEDCEFNKLLDGLDLSTGVYIDIGANQPSYISNTYFFYKKGLNGILIEPDESNVLLLKRFRNRDITIKAVVGSTPKLCRFNYAIASVHNSVQPLPASSLLKQEYIPQITVDEIVECINPKWIYLLTTDTEGNDLEVLRGSSQALKRTLLVCTEYHGDQERLQLEKYMQENSFERIFLNSVNLIFRNTEFPKHLIEVE